MTDDDPQPNTGPEVGSVAQEAAKLMAALAGLAPEQESFADAARNVSDHIGHDQDCRYCPVCQLINVARTASPEIKQGLATAATALLQVAQGLLNTDPPTDSPPRDDKVEKIDLDEA